MEKILSGGRRRWMALLGGAVAAVGLTRAVRASAAGQTTPPADPGERLRLLTARQEICELRHAYGIATDLIGGNREPGLGEGRDIYRRIFTADARIGAAGIDPVTGPDAWVDVVAGALQRFSATQHLIGTQHVTALRLPDAGGAGGTARMQSYLQAWHSTADGDLWLFMGTYQDELVYSESHGWQIASMMLHQVAADYRRLGEPPAA
jgi:hypothetical protein